MTVPRKDDLVAALDRFADELRSLAKFYEKTEDAQPTMEQVNGIADIAEGASRSIQATERQYVHPDTAQTLAGLADRTDEIADAATDQTFATSLRIAATGLRTFVLRQTPSVTSDGLRFAE